MAYVYLIVEDQVDGEIVKDWVKIGYSQNPPEWRMDTNLSRGNPRTIRVAAAFEYDTNDEAWNAEKSAHVEFSKYLFQKEWFQIHWKEVEAWFTQQRTKPRIDGVEMTSQQMRAANRPESRPLADAGVSVVK